MTGGIAASQCVRTGGPAPSPGEATGGEKEDLAGELDQLPETSCTPRAGMSQKDWEPEERPLPVTTEGCTRLNRTSVAGAVIEG